jgi:transcriptional regulator with XRE-family HTH domain
MRAQKKTFKDIYLERKQLPTHAEMFVTEVAELTHRSTNTVKMWLLGRQVPDELTQSVIAKKYNVDINSLFPVNEAKVATV